MYIWSTIPLRRIWIVWELIGFQVGQLYSAFTHCKHRKCSFYIQKTNQCTLHGTSIGWYCKTPCAQMYPPSWNPSMSEKLSKNLCGWTNDRWIGSNDSQLLSTYIYYNSKYFWVFLHYKDIIQKKKNIILYQKNDMLNYSKC